MLYRELKIKNNLDLSSANTTLILLSTW